MNDDKSILDTNIVSYFMKGGPMAQMYEPLVQGQLLCISFVTVGELYFGAEKANWGEKKGGKLETTLRNFIIVPYDSEIARCYGRLVAEKQKSGESISPNDAWIAACAVRHSMALITHDAKDFENVTGLKVVTALRDNQVI